MKKFSLIVPVYNEISGIKDFMDSLYQQTRKPDEIILVDNQSTDGTLEFLQNEEKKGKIQLFSFPCNVPSARNFAISRAKNDIILCTDAGCLVDPHRAEEIMNIYETDPQALAVGGSSGYILTTPFQKHALTHVLPKYHSKPTFPSRNISFLKSLREQVGAYPEYLKWGEDTFFNYKIEKTGTRIILCEKAIVSWGIGNSYRDFYKLFRNYTQGDMEVFMIHGIKQSNSILWGLTIWIVLGISIVLAPFFHMYLLILAVIGIISIGLTKRSGGGLIFDCCFTMSKMTGITIGVRKGLWNGLRIKKRLQASAIMKDDKIIDKACGSVSENREG